MKRAAVLLVIALFMLAACAPSVKGICDDLEDDCDVVVNVENCLSDGRRLETDAERNGCIDVFDAYLECLDEDVCSSDARCEGVEGQLRECVGMFPPFGS